MTANNIEAEDASRHGLIQALGIYQPPGGTQMHSQITAAQARANFEASTYGTDEVVKAISKSIEANSKAGATHIVHSLSREAVSDPELQGAVAKLESLRFSVEQIGTTAGSFTVKVSW